MYAFILQSVELTTEVIDFLKDIFCMFDMDAVCTPNTILIKFELYMIEY